MTTFISPEILNGLARLAMMAYGAIAISYGVWTISDGLLGALKELREYLLAAILIIIGLVAVAIAVVI